MAEKKSAHHDEFMKLHMFKEEYIAKLEAIGITSPEELTEALGSEDTTKLIHEHLKGVGPKTVEHWCEDLGVKGGEKTEEEPAATKTRKVKPAAKKAEGKAKEEEKGGKEDEVEIEEESGYRVKLKPKLPKELIDALRKRGEIDAKRPAFLRQEWHTRQRLQGVKWRKPRGGHSKVRQHYNYRRIMVSIGFGGPKAARGLHPSGFSEIAVRNMKDLLRVKPETEAARIAHQVGTKKRLELEEKADELKIRVLNRSG